MTGWYDRHVVPRLIRCGCAQPVVTELRRQVVPLARGAVLEVGCGGGLNLPFYDRGAVTSLTGVDPSPELLDMTVAAARTADIPMALHRAGGEALPFAYASFDDVVMTFTLCSVGDPAAVLGEIRRVLRPGGRLLFAEHGGAPDAGVARWQRRVEPVWKRIAGGCHLTRPVRGMLAEARFGASGKAGYAPKTPRILGWMEWGQATV